MGFMEGPVDGPAPAYARGVAVVVACTRGTAAGLDEEKRVSEVSGWRWTGRRECDGTSTR